MNASKGGNFEDNPYLALEMTLFDLLKSGARDACPLRELCLRPALFFSAKFDQLSEK